MRTISSFRLVGTLALPKNLLPFVGFGKIPAVSSALAFGSTMQLGMVLFGKGEPCVIPAGAAPPGQFRKSTLEATCAWVGTVIAVVPKFAPVAPGNVAGSGTCWPLLM